MDLVEEKKKKRQLAAQQEADNRELFHHLQEKEKERERNEPLKKISPDCKGISKVMPSRDAEHESLHYTINGKVEKVDREDNGEYFWNGGNKIKQRDDYDTSQCVY